MKTILLFSLFVIPASIFATDFHVTVDGQPGNPGSESEPWDLASALLGKPSLTPGDTLWIHGGTYKHPNREPGAKGYTVKLAGAPDRPIQVRAVRGQRVTIDGGLQVVNPSRHLWIRDLEIVVSENLTQTRSAAERGSHPKDLARPWGSLNILGGDHCKYIHLVVHDNAQGIGYWKSATNSEIYGCLVYNNGWIGPDRYHGPGIYGQNETGIKRVTHTIFFGNYSNTTQFYGSSRAYVDNFHLDGNIAFGPLKEGGRSAFLLGGGRGSKGIVVRNNLLYDISMRIGYTAKDSEDCLVEGNTILRGGLSINGFSQVTKRDNTVMRDPLPRSVVLQPSAHDPHRANLAIVNGLRSPSVEVDLSSFLKPGDKFRIQSALDFFGPPVVKGRFASKSVSIPIPAEALTGQGEFSVFVLFRDD